MPELNEVLEEAQREIKAIGANVTALDGSMKKDLADLRVKVDEIGTKTSDQTKKDLEALAAGVTEKHTALADLVKGAGSRMDELEKKLNRGKIAGGWGNDSDVKSAKMAEAFARHALIMRSELKFGQDPADKLDLASVQAYGKSYPLYLRRGDELKGGVGADEIKAMSAGSDPDGGYLVSPTVGDVIQGVIFETSPMRAIANIETISTGEIEYPRDDDESSAGWVGEQETRLATNTPQGGLQRIPVHELYALPQVTQKLLEDVAWDVEAWLGRKVGDKFGRTEATAFVAGTGFKQPRGFVTYASGAYAAGSSGKIEQVAAASSGVVVWDDLINLMTALKEYYLSNAVWLMRRATVGSLMLLKDGTGHYIWQPNQQAGKPAVLLGYEVNQAADMAAVGASALPIAFGNFKMGYTIVDRIGMSTLRDPYSAKPFIQFYSRKRVGGDVTNFEAMKLLAT